jgi:tRNA nucleotidyltransferase (CCA-adding enzyme)
MNKNKSFEILVRYLNQHIINSLQPSEFLTALRQDGNISYFPELASMIGVPQEPEWHPEGDVWTHLLLVLDRAAEFKNELDDKSEREIYMFGALCHDLGKPFTTIYSEGRWRSPGHDIVGEIPTRSLLSKFGYGDIFADEVVKYVVHHLKPSNLYKTRDHVSLKAIQRLAEKIDIHKLVLLAKADHYGRTIPEAEKLDYAPVDWLLRQYELMIHCQDRNKVSPLVTGKMLLELDMQPGKEMGAVIDEGFRLQSEGKLRTREQAYQWAKELLQKRNGKGRSEI